jgi:hypothetical protein
MCQFCHQHGEGKKWYLKAEHYSQDLLSDLRRRTFMKDFIVDVGNGHAEQLEKKFHFGMQAPAWLRHTYYWFTERRYRRDHYGQVVPLEDLDKVLDFASSIVRIPCICRKSSTGKNDARYCFGLSIDPEKFLDIKEAFLETFRSGPEVDIFEHLSKAEALDLLQSSSPLFQGRVRCPDYGGELQWLSFLPCGLPVRGHQFCGGPQNRLY